jgi:hypothetical protein
MDELEEYIQVNHQINMTSLFADFSKLQESISIETIDVQSIQDTLKKVDIMKDLDNFNPTQLHLEKLSHLSTWTAVLFWLIAALAVVATCCCCYCLCPACCGQCVTCFCTNLCKCIPTPKMPQRLSNPLRSFSTNEYASPIHFQADTSQILIPQRASAPILKDQVIITENPVNESIELISFGSTPTVSYPALPPEEWYIQEFPLRNVLTNGELFYCHHNAKSYFKDCKVASVPTPSQSLIDKIRESPAPPITAAFDQPTNIFSWQSPEHGSLIWRNPHWQGKDSQVFYCGYGVPIPAPTPPKS